MFLVVLSLAKKMVEMSPRPLGVFLRHLPHRFRRKMTPYHQSSPSPCGFREFKGWRNAMQNYRISSVIPSWKFVEETSFCKVCVMKSDRVFFFSTVASAEVDFLLGPAWCKCFTTKWLLSLNKEIYSPVPLSATSVICGIVKIDLFWAQKYYPLFQPVWPHLHFLPAGRSAFGHRIGNIGLSKTIVTKWLPRN